MNKIEPIITKEDPYLRKIPRQSIAGEITGDECRRLSIEYINKKHRVDATS